MLFFEFHGLSAANVAEHAAEVSAIVDAHGGRDFTRADSPEARATLWQARHDAYHAALALRPVARLDDRRLRPDLPAGRLHPRNEGRSRHLPLIGPLIGHVGDGNFHLVIPVDPESPEDLAEAERLTDGSWSGRWRWTAPARASTASASAR